MTFEEVVALLDQRVPGWVDRIDVDRLNQDSLSDCILGQLFGVFERGKRALGADSSWVFGPFDSADSEGNSWTPRWKEYIQSRRNKGMWKKIENYRDIKNIPVGTKIRVDGQETTLTHHWIEPDYGIGIDNTDIRYSGIIPNELIRGGKYTIEHWVPAEKETSLQEAKKLLEENGYSVKKKVKKWKWIYKSGVTYHVTGYLSEEEALPFLCGVMFLAQKIEETEIEVDE